MKSKTIFLIPLFVAITSCGLFTVALLNGWMGKMFDVDVNSNDLIKQPFNTWMSLGFIATGLAMAWLLMQGAFRQHKNRFTQGNFTAIFFTSLVVLIAPSAMSYHATLTRIGNELDMLSIYFMVAFMVAYALQRFFKWKRSSFIVTFLLVVVLSELMAKYLQYMWPGIQGGQIAIAFFIITAITVEMIIFFTKKGQYEIKWIAYALLAFIPAFAIFRLCGYDNPICGILALVQGHAVWQLLVMVSLFFLFRYYVSENIHTTDQNLKIKNDSPTDYHK
jgi:uncharacterized membrane protein YsdA (DUF1294 family)